MSWHLLVHYLDNLRGCFASSNIGNGPEAITEAIVLAVIWNRWVGPLVRRWHRRELDRHHEAVTTAVSEQLKAHHASIEDKIAEALKKAPPTRTRAVPSKRPGKRAP